MVIDLLNFIADEVYDRNLYFNNYVAIALQQDDGKVYKFTTSQERTFCGLSDADGIAFYIKVNPVMSFTKGRQITSSKKVSQGTIECNLIAYQTSSEINTINWQKKLSEALNSINFSGHSGTEHNIQVEIKSTSNSAEQIFKEETGKPLDTELKIVSIKYNLIFSTSSFDCDECNIFDSEGCNVDPQDVCDRFVQRINNLPVEIKNCIKDVICEECPSPGPPCNACTIEDFELNIPSPGTVSIDWTTLTEVNVQIYILDRKLQSDTCFEEGIEVSFPAGENQFHSIINAPPGPGTYTYRLRVLMTDGFQKTLGQSDVIIT